MKLRVAAIFTTKWPWLVLLIGLALSTALSYRVQQNNHLRTQEAVSAAFQVSVQAILARLELYQYGLRGARGAILMAGEQQINRGLFRLYSDTRDIDTEFFGARGIGFVRRVPIARQAAFLQQAQADGWPDFTFKEINSNSGERYIIQYIEPVERNLAAVGLDIASEANRFNAANSSMRSGEVHLTGPITLVQATGKPEQSFLIMMPIYRGGLTPATVTERERLAFGWSYAPLLMTEVLADKNLDPVNVRLKLSDITDPAQPTAFFDNGDDALQTFYPLNEVHRVFGRDWQFDYTVTEHFIDNLHLPSPLQLGLLGGAMSLLLAMLSGIVMLNQANKQKLQLEQAKLASIVASSVDGIISSTLQGQISSWNHGAEVILGYQSDEVIGRDLVAVVCPTPMWSQDAEMLQQFAEGKATPNFETVLRKTDGSNVDVSITISPIYNVNGEVVGTSNTVRDISEKKAAEAKIHELNANLETQVQQRTADLLQTQEQLLETTEQLTLAHKVAELGIWEWSVKTNALEWNDKMFALYQQPHSLKQTGLQYTHWESRVHPDDRADAVAQLQAAVDGVGSYAPIFRVVLPNGNIRYLQAAAYVHRDHQGKATKVIGINRDITAEHELEQSLREAKLAAEASNQAKSMFLANMSHEIRTPMNAVLGMLQLIKTTELTILQDDYTSKAEIAAKSLLGLLNDILDYSKIEAGKLELEQSPFSIDALMSELAVVLSTNLGDKNVELLFDLDPTLPAVITGDRLRLQQILLNLATNAIKFTTQGEVIIRLQVQQQTAAQAQIRFSITDTGIGISPAQQKRIFDGFTQAEASTARVYGGSGLGLVISKRMVQMMGGELQLQSELGQGSCFWFELALAVSDESAVAETPYVAINKAVNVLIVDDNAAALVVLSKAVQQQGASVYTASSGTEALAQLEQLLAAKQSIHAVLMDYSMPDMDGLTVAKRIKQRLASGHVPVIVMVTAFGREALANAKDMSPPPYDAFLTKPVTPSQIGDLLMRAISGEKVSFTTRVAPAISAQPLAGLQLLLVEDNELNRIVAQELLSKEGAMVDVAVGGQEGVDQVLANPNAYDLVLMDMQMPNVDGLAATRLIRADARFSQLPIIAMTANVAPEDHQRCIDAGMNDHLGKPFELSELIATILAFTRKASEDTTAASAVPQLPESPRTPVVKAAPANTNSPARALTSKAKAKRTTPRIAELLKRFGGNEKLFRRLLKLFETNMQQQLQALAEVIEQQDWPALLAILHTLKGSSGTIGLKTLYAEVSALEARFSKLTTDNSAELVNLVADLSEHLRFVANLELSQIHAAFAKHDPQ